MARACFLLFFCGLSVMLLMGSCANIVIPGGGPKDSTLPKLLHISPPDSQLHARPRKIELQFDKYVTLTDAANQVQVSPLLPIPLTVTSTPRRIIITIPDTLLQDETTYRITLGTAIRDLHEGNPYTSKGYTFSTGSYFDSLNISGKVIDARTGQPDTAAFVLLYKTSDGDSAVVRHRPMYVTHVDGSGAFSLTGLPPRSFRLYALRDANGNLIFDGGKEAIGFEDAPVRPGDAAHTPYLVRTFQEAAINDTSARRGDRQHAALNTHATSMETPHIPATGYRVGVDTSDAKKRTQDITKPLVITFSRKPLRALNHEKVFLSSDSAGTTVEEDVRIAHDTSGLQDSLITQWRENAVYTLRLQKGFAKDTSGADLLPGRFTFRTKRDEDYGKLRIHLPTKYFGVGNVLLVNNERDTVWQQPVTDSNVALLRLPPGVYTVRVIVDENRNGRWDPGDLFLRRQPEEVVPYAAPINLKAGWEQQIDFETPRVRIPDPAGKLRR